MGGLGVLPPPKARHAGEREGEKACMYVRVWSREMD